MNFTHSELVKSRGFIPALFSALVLLSLSVPAQANYTCLQPHEPSPELTRAYQRFHSCTSDELDDWLGRHTERVSQLESLYQAWIMARQDDLRGTPEAAIWVNEHPTDFSKPRVGLSAEEVAARAPQHRGNPLGVEGVFQRFFVDRDAQRLFLTTSTEGLVSISTERRYDFELEGALEQSSGSDFFIIDSRWAYIEEPVSGTDSRDLVVLDIEDPSRPVEIQRLRGVLPGLSEHSRFQSSMLSRAPSFAEYVAIREGRMTTPGCSALPQVEGERVAYCSAEGRCYKEVTGSTRSGLDCVANIVPTRPPNVSIRPGRRVPAGALSAPTARARVDARPAIAPQAEVMGGGSFGRAGAGTAADSQASEQGAEGGAGSLSQMMRHENALYVLTTHASNRKGWLTTFDISRPQAPSLVGIQALDNGPEALQRHDNLLLIAGRDALVTASIAEVHAPRLLGEHRQNCPVRFDPVVVEGGIAYRTIIVSAPRSVCRSRLEVIDLTQPHQPIMRNTVTLSRPRGLAVFGGALFIADEHTGLQLYSLADPTSPALANTWSLPGVSDIVLSGYDLYAMSAREIVTMSIAPLFEVGARMGEIIKELDLRTTVVTTGSTGSHRGPSIPRPN